VHRAMAQAVVKAFQPSVTGLFVLKPPILTE
jgi:hypothetical protein